MRAGQLTAIPVDDATFWVKLSWGTYKKLNKLLHGLDENDTDAVLDFAEDNLIKLVVKCECLEAEDGTPVTELTGQVVEDLPPAIVMSLWQKIMAIGEEVGNAAGPPA